MHYNEICTLVKKTASLLISILPYVFWVLLLYSFDSPSTAATTLLCALIHEAGHEIYLYRKYRKLFLPSGKLHGMMLTNKIKREMSYLQEAWLYASGPTANFLCAFASLPFVNENSGYALCFAVINIATAISNLVPIKGYDGYGMLRCILEHKYGSSASHTALCAISFTFTLLLCLLSLYMIDRFAEGFWLFAVFIFSLVSAIGEGIKNANFEK